jgi:rhamnose utilization protein RhaD (predicted bifunctional aldolase and dehydrogenase)
MTDAQLILKELITLSHELGLESRQLAILGEGNTSADLGDGTFWIKASGSSLPTIDERGFSRVSMDAVAALVKSGPLTEQQIEDGLMEVLVDKTQRKPSVETFLHAICLSQPDVNWIGHTHPVSVLKILCSKLGAEPFLKPLFPDGIVVCGLDPVVVPYVDPGAALSGVIGDALHQYQDAHGRSPRTILMINHGLIALGKTAREALNISMMADKVAKVLWGTYALGGPNYMDEVEANRIENRLDEAYRRKVLESK